MQQSFEIIDSRVQKRLIEKRYVLTVSVKLCSWLQSFDIQTRNTIWFFMKAIQKNKEMLKPSYLVKSLNVNTLIRLAIF